MKKLPLNLPRVLLVILIVLYIAYFGTLSVLKVHHLYAEYFDVGIMNQTVHNSYMALKTGDYSRILELTDPHGTTNQINRMAIHADPILALLAPFYFIHDGPETILILQAVVLALGAWAVFLIAERITKYDWLSLAFAFAYLMYPPMQWANIFEFHAVTFATTFILFMAYFWLTRKYRISVIFMMLALLTKEEVGLSIGVFGVYAAYDAWVTRKKIPKWYPVVITGVSWTWSVLAVFVITPFFNSGKHFASGYYDNLIPNIAPRIFKESTYQYFLATLGPLLFLPVLAPQFLIIASPELAINLLSANEQLRDLGFHYMSAIQPWFFMGAIFGAKPLVDYSPKIAKNLAIALTLATLIFSYLNSPLPYSRDPKFDAFRYKREGEVATIMPWVKKLADDSIKVSTTDQLAPLFTNRRYYYIFSDNYQHADYVVISQWNLDYTWRKDEELPAYENLKKDKTFTKIFSENRYEVYRRVGVSD